MRCVWVRFITVPCDSFVGYAARGGSFRQPVRTGSDDCRCGSYRFGSYGSLSRRWFGSVQADRFGSEAILQEIHEFWCASKNRESFWI